MIEYMNKIPEFYLGNDNEIPLQHTTEFHDMIISFIEINIDNPDCEDVLCHLILSDGSVIVAKLPKAEYRKSILKSMDFYIENENYEKCALIKKLLEKI